MKLFNITRPQTVEAEAGPTLEQLWRRAEQIGRIEVDTPLMEKTYRVRIKFARASGTTIWAEGRDPNIAYALAQAIKEAIELGAS